MNPVSQRLLSQQLICPQFTTPREVVGWMGAMQAQDYRGMRWAVEMRTRKPSAKAFKKAYDCGEIVRIHLMRGTWQLVTADDYRSMVDLCGARALAVTKGWMTSNRISIPDEELMRVREVLCRIVGDLRSATKEDIVRGLEERDIRMDDHRLSYHLRIAEFSGILCSGDLLPMKASYALSASKLPCSVRRDRDEALRTLTRQYFRHSQPATLEDFVWWSGLGVNDCRKGIGLLGDWLHIEKWRGREFYLTDEGRTQGFRKGRCLLLPPYDEYLISYKSRDIALPREHTARAHNSTGNFWPVVLVDGRVAGNWRAAGGQVTADPFPGGPGIDLESLDREIARYQGFLSR